MQTLNFSLKINASKEKVWIVLLADKTYRIWTNEFSPGSYAVTDWKEGSKSLFLSVDKNGMMSTIVKNKPNEFLSIKHLRIIKDGIEDLDSEETKKWSGAMENYTLRETNGITELIVNTDATDEYKDFFTKTWPKALQKVKELSEAKALFKEYFTKTKPEALQKVKEQSDFNEAMCPIPWIHFVPYPSGVTQICTHQSDYSVCVGNIFDNTFEEIINHENLRKLRFDMMRGKKNLLCSNCRAFEKANKGISPRTIYLQKYGHLLSDCISNTQEDGYFDPKYFKFVFWNFKISGVCNLKCRTCHPHFSTSIYHEHKKLGWISEENFMNFEKIKENLPKVMAQMLKHIEYVEEVHFVGGEPMFMNEHWQILDELIKHNRRDVRLAYHTNLTKLTYKDKHVFDFWKQFTGDIWLSPSIDAVCEKNAYIRDGSKWNIINDNLDKVVDLKNVMNNLSVVPTITASVLNVLYMDELVDFLCTKKVNDLIFNIVRNPSFYHLSLLPHHLKRTAINKLNNCAERNNLDKHIFNIIKSELFNKEVLYQKNNLLSIFKEETLKLDDVRNINFKTVFPELIEMVD